MTNDFLTKSEFYEYMGDFRVALENRLTKLEKKMENGGCPSTDHKNTDDKNGTKEIWPFMRYIIGALVGGLLMLAGVNYGSKLLGG